MDVKLPQLGEQTESGIVLTVLVSEGDRVTKDQPLLELETDKATTEVPAPEGGVVRQVLVSEGDEVQSGDKVVVLGGSDEAEDAEGARAGSGEADGGAERAAAASEEAGEGAEDQRERAEAGRRDAAGSEGRDEETRAEETPAQEEAAEEPGAKEGRGGRGGRGGQGRGGGAPKSRGERREPQAAEGRAAPGAPASAVDRKSNGARRGGNGAPRQRSAGAGRARGGGAAEPSLAAQRAASAGAEPMASPAVRKLARELGISELTAVAASGERGRITEEDLKSHVRHLLGRLPPPAREDERPRLPDLSRWGEVETEPLGAVRKATAKNVARAWELIPHVTQGDRADVTELEGFRRRYGTERGVGLSPTAILVSVVGRALRRFPQLNSAIDPDQGVRVLRRYVSVAVAVDTERGLLVPVIREADQKGLSRIAQELSKLAEEAREGTLRPEQMEGAGLTITNLGGLGTTTFTPIVAWPQVAILGVGRARLEPVHASELGREQDEFVARRVMPLSLSYDHRAIDGADAARFLRWICRVLEDPLLLLD